MFTKERSFGQPIEILKFNDFKGKACMVSDTGITADAAGHKIVKAGTPINKNGVLATTTDGKSDVVGILLHDTDVSNGTQPATYIFEGSVDMKALATNKITIDEAIKAALPRVTFFD